MKRSLVRVMALLAVGGLVVMLGPAAAPSRADDTVNPAGLTAFFVVGDQSAGAPTIGAAVQFWGAQWAMNNSLSGGPAPASFKGYADSGTVTMTANGLCGGEWLTSPGNSSAPPATLSTPFVVILTSTVVQSGPVITGDVAGAVVVNPDPGYAPDPGHAGTGTIQQVLCPSPPSPGE